MNFDFENINIDRIEIMRDEGNNNSDVSNSELSAVPLRGKKCPDSSCKLRRKCELASSGSSAAFLLDNSFTSSRSVRSERVWSVNICLYWRHEDITCEGLDNAFILHQHCVPGRYRNYQVYTKREWRKVENSRRFVSHTSVGMLPRKKRIWQLLQYIPHHRWNRKLRSLLVLLFQRKLYSNLFQEQMEMPGKWRGAKTTR